MYMKKIFLSFGLLLLCSLSLLFVTGCFGGANLASGDQVTLTTSNYDQYIKIHKRRLSSIKKNDKYVGVKYKFETDGYDKFSYYSVVVTIRVSMRCLNDSGTYENRSFDVTLHLSATGEDTRSDQETFDSVYRNLASLEWDVTSVSGYIVKK